MTNTQRIYVTPNDSHTEAAQTAPSADMPQKPLMAIVDLDRYGKMKEIIMKVISAINADINMFISWQEKPEWVDAKEYKESFLYQKNGKNVSGSDIVATVLATRFSEQYDIVLVSQDIDWLYIAKLTGSNIVYLDRTQFGNKLEYSADMETSLLSTPSSQLLKLAELCQA